MPRPRPSNSFTEIAGAAVHYDRFEDPQFTYGTLGRPLRFYVKEEFEQKLDDCFNALWDMCPLGQAEVITSAGAFVDKRGAHGKGRGFDIDGIFWEDRAFIALQYPQDKRFYLGIESVLRKHFGVVLNYKYNAAHRDHLHVDDTSPVSFFPDHRSIVLYLQMALTHLFERPVTIDGMMGPETNGAARDLLLALDLANPDAVATDAALHETLDDVWVEVLDRAAAEGLGAAVPAEEEPSPLDLLSSVYAVVDNELDGRAARKRIETALTAFANHADIADFLDTYRPET